jgi:hypothetical protein
LQEVPWPDGANQDSAKSSAASKWVVHETWYERFLFSLPYNYAPEDGMLGAGVTQMCSRRECAEFRMIGTIL